MTARWDKLPRTPKRRAPRRPVRRCRWRCHTCGEVIDGTWESAERHADAHGGARLDQVIDDGTAAR